MGVHSADPGPFICYLIPRYSLSCYARAFNITPSHPSLVTCLAILELVTTIHSPFPSSRSILTIQSTDSRDTVLPRPRLSDQAQEAALAQFRQELEAENLCPSGQARDAHAAALGYDRYDDQTLLRFLRARKFDLPKAKIMWEANEKWRKEFGADEIAA